MGQNFSLPLLVNAMNGVGPSCDASMASVSAQFSDPTKNSKMAIQQYKSNYYKMIEDNNASSSNTLTKESSYFIAKYGSNIYNQLLEYRLRYLNPTTTQSDGFDLTGYFQVLESISALNQVLTIDKPMLNILDTYLPEYDANTLYREIEYRDVEYAKLSKINYYVNILYYCAFVVLILLLFSSGNLLLRERFVLYIFLGLLPILYPWAFMLSRRIFNYIYPSFQYNGPVNAFVDTNTNITTMFSNNVSNSFKKNEEATTI